MYTVTEKMFCAMQKEMMLSLYGNCYATPYRVDAAYDAVIRILAVLVYEEAIVLSNSRYVGILPNGQVIEL